MIHNSSVIDKKAKIGEKVKIGPFCFIGSNVEISDDVELISNVHIEGNTKIGKGSKIFPFASIGTQPQDLKYKGESNSLEIGKKADILILNCGEMDQFPLYDPLFAIATMMVGRDVKTVIIDGKVVMKDRELLTIDQEKLKHELMSRLPKIMERFQMVPE